jgi:hypothetical protein
LRVIKRTLSPGAGICVGGVLNYGGGAGVDANWLHCGGGGMFVLICPVAALTVKHMCYY